VYQHAYWINLSLKKFQIRFAGFGIVFFALTLQGCSLIQTSYNKAPQITEWWLDNYLDITSKQKSVLKEDLSLLHRWHRTTQLEKYIKLLKTLDNKLSSDLDPPTICAMESDVKALVYDFLVSFEPALTHLALELKPEQLQFLQSKYSKNNREWRHDYIEGSAQRRLEYRAKKDKEIGEWLYGKLTAEQLQLLERLIQESPFEPDKTFAERLRRQADSIETLKAIIQSHPSEEEARQTLHALLIRSTLESPDAQYKEYLNKSLMSQCTRAVLFHNATTPQQRTHALKSLMKLEQDLEELSHKTQ
jgi:hypothetical protein